MEGERICWQSLCSPAAALPHWLKVEAFYCFSFPDILRDFFCIAVALGVISSIPLLPDLTIRIQQMLYSAMYGGNTVLVDYLLIAFDRPVTPRQALLC